uniref:uncharacterized protein LOC118145795 n=1 Tax=Callithrix jacchus TaxID=9483 RepID=UPI00159E0B62|nr:uncharacterized protein LOC118145795 [Callithrix jacchus]
MRGTLSPVSLSCPRPDLRTLQRVRGLRVPTPFPGLPSWGPAEGRRGRPGRARVKKLIQFALITELFRSGPSTPPLARSQPRGDCGGGPGKGMETGKRRSLGWGQGGDVGRQRRQRPGGIGTETVMETGARDTGTQRETGWSADKAETGDEGKPSRLSLHLATDIPAQIRSPALRAPAQQDPFRILARRTKQNSSAATELSRAAQSTQPPAFSIDLGRSCRWGVQDSRRSRREGRVFVSS